VQNSFKERSTNTVLSIKFIEKNLMRDNRDTHAIYIAYKQN